MRQLAERYARTESSAISSRASEIAAFQLVIQGLQDASRDGAEESLRIAAFGRTHELWSLLLRDLAREGNALPDGLKAELTGLGFWAMRYATLAILKSLPAAPLIEVCGNVLAGLQAQQPGPGQQAPAACAAAPQSVIAAFQV